MKTGLVLEDGAMRGMYTAEALPGKTKEFLAPCKR